uniref:Uncharacterized protein n=1 Tax=Pseudocodium devriesii TaxID=453070 RepID=A0A386B116_9CHLO|nr:hypothetical protein [Pseudocodium devriesii]AYC65391.1 hypothetical protein [Pseudocodium devriesii]
MDPLTVTNFFRNYFFTRVFINVCSDKFVWVSTKVAHLDGSLKLSEGALTQIATENFLPQPQSESLDMNSRLRVSLTLYNKSTPISFFLYGVRENTDTQAMSEALLQMCTEGLVIPSNWNLAEEGSAPEVCLRFAGITSGNQVTENQFVVSISCKKQPIPLKQAYRSITNKDNL